MEMSRGGAAVQRERLPNIIHLIPGDMAVLRILFVIKVAFEIILIE